MEELTDDTHSREMDKLRREYSDNEARQRSLKIAGDSPATPVGNKRSSEGREFRDLITRSNVGEIFDAAVNHNVGQRRDRRDSAALRTGLKPSTTWPC